MGWVNDIFYLAVTELDVYNINIYQWNVTNNKFTNHMSPHQSITPYNNATIKPYDITIFKVKKNIPYFWIVCLPFYFFKLKMCFAFFFMFSKCISPFVVLVSVCKKQKKKLKKQKCYYNNMNDLKGALCKSLVFSIF